MSRATALIANLPRSQRLSAILNLLAVFGTFAAFLVLPRESVNLPGIMFVTAAALAFTLLYYGIPKLSLNPRFLLLADAVYIAAITIALFFVGPNFPYFFYLYFLVLAADALAYDARSYRIAVEMVILSLGIRTLFTPDFFTVSGIALLVAEWVAIILIGAYLWVFASEAVAERARRVRAEKEAKRLAELERLKADFLDLASHEMRTPLGHIKGYAEVLRGKRDVNAVDRIEANANRLLRLVAQMLSVSKIEQEQTSQFRSDIDIGRLLTDITHEFRVQTQKKGLHVVVSKVPEGTVVVGSPEDIKDVFSNLVDNALRYTRKGGKINLDTSVHGGRVVVSVKDTGIGIPKSEQHNLFKRFFRAPNAQTFEPSGNGLGLYLVKEIVERHHGSITVASEEGTGTTFLVSLPKKGGT